MVGPSAKGRQGGIRAVSERIQADERPGSNASHAPTHAVLRVQYSTGRRRSCISASEPWGERISSDGCGKRTTSEHKTLWGPRILAGLSQPTLPPWRGAPRPSSVEEGFLDSCTFATEAKQRYDSR